MPKLRRETTTHVPVLRALTVAGVRDLTPGMRRITLAGAELREREHDGVVLPALSSPGFDDHVKVFVPLHGAELPVLPHQRVDGLDWTTEGTRPTASDYTPRRIDLELGEIDLDFVRHGHGNAAGWAERATVGAPAWIAGPTIGQALPHDVDWFMVAGDETALPAIGRLLEELPAGVRVQALIEVADAGDEQPLPTQADAHVTWLHRDGAEAGTTTLLADAVRDAPWWEGEAYAWMAGESSAARAVRTFWRTERHVARDCLDVSGYWRR